MIQLNLYSDNTLNYYIEYYVTYFIEEYGLLAIHYINEAKIGIAIAYELPEECKTNLTLSLDTYYEPVRDSSCMDEIVYYQMVLYGSNICQSESGQTFMKRMFLENFDDLYPCAQDYG
jgi:hypothetical protein